MKKFFLHDGKDKQGPFSADELKSKNIHSDTPVWYEGATDWKKASEVPELEAVLKATPPPFTPEKGSGENERNRNRIFLIALLALLLLGGGIFLFTGSDENAEDVTESEQVEEACEEEVGEPIVQKETGGNNNPKEVVTEKEIAEDPVEKKVVEEIKPVPKKEVNAVPEELKVRGFRKVLKKSAGSGLTEFNVTVDIKANKPIEGLCTLKEKIPHSSQVDVVNTAGATGKYDGVDVKYVWNSFPGENKATVTYKFVLQDRKADNAIISGKFLFNDTGEDKLIKVHTLK